VEDLSNRRVVGNEGAEVEPIIEGLEGIGGVWWLIGAAALVGLAKLGRPLVKSGIKGYLASRDSLGRGTTGIKAGMRRLYEEAVAEHRGTASGAALAVAVRSIPRSEWEAFFVDFTRQHEGQLVTLDAPNIESGAPVELRELPLAGIWTDVDSQRAETIEIMVGTETEEHLTHTISAPTHVRLQQAGDGTAAALEITAARRQKTVLHLPARVRPEMKGRARR
jgi:hypothetical protein